jgi:kynurenine 3-monooxygenase
VRLHFEHDTDLDDALEGQIKWTTPDGKGSGCFDAVFSTDGANSGIRKALQAEGAMEWTEQVIDHGYKELLIPAGPNATSLIEREALHIWPRASYMLIGLPNPDGSFTMTLFFPNEGPVSFAALDTPEAAEVFFAEFFADALALMPDFKEQWAQNPVSKLSIVRSWPWSKGKVVLFGDATHAIVPFYGQGMNSGFEDCFELNRMMDALGENPATLFPAFEAERKPNADAIAELALLNFIEMRDLTGQPEFLLRKKIESKLHSQRPHQWIPLYTQVTFSHIPYSVALERGRQMDRVFAEVMQWPGIAENWDQPETLAKIWEVAEQQLVPSY